MSWRLAESLITLRDLSLGLLCKSVSVCIAFLTDTLAQIIEPRIRMPFRAGGFTGINARPSFPAKQIFTKGHRFQMLRIYASSISAKMVNSQSVGNRANSHFIGDSMGKTHPAEFTTGTNTPVAVAIFGRLPFPASIRSLFINLAPQAFSNRFYSIFNFTRSATNRCVPDWFLAVRARMFFMLSHSNIIPQSSEGI